MENDVIKNDDLLKDFVANNDYKPNVPNNEKIEQIGPNIRHGVSKIEVDSDWMNIPIKDLPHSEFYSEGIRISIRPLKTKEMQSFAVVNEKNPYDVIAKLNELLSACVKIENMETGEALTYKDIYDGDRDTLAMLIAKASAKYGRKIEKIEKCPKCAEENKIEMVPSNYKYKTHHEKLLKYFNVNTKKYEFTLKSGASVKMAPPTLGLVQDVNNYILVKTTKTKETPNITFMQTFPYIQSGIGIKSMTYEQLEQAEYEFTKMNQDLFQFVYDTVDMISFGIDDCKVTCKCGQEVHTHFGFPNGPRDLFIVSNAFDEFIG